MILTWRQRDADGMEALEGRRLVEYGVRPLITPGVGITPNNCLPTRPAKSSNSPKTS